MTEEGVNLMLTLFGSVVGVAFALVLVILLITAVVKLSAKLLTKLGYDQFEFRMDNCVPEGIKKAEKYANSPTS